MIKSIDEFVKELSTFSLDEATQRYVKAVDISEFTRIELSGVHESTRAGIQMIYVIGKGKINYNLEETDALFYFNCMITSDFFRDERDSRDVKSIPLNKISEIKPLQFSNEDSYSRIKRWKKDRC
jgi:hypothetical protein